MFGRKDDNTNRAMSVDKESNQGCQRIFLTLFFGIFFAVGSGMLYFFAVKPIWGVYSASNWQAAPCEIVSSRLEERPGDDGSTYRIEIKYKNVYDDKPYESDQYKFFNVASNVGVSGKREIVRNHPPGKKTTCYVNPDDPTQAVIERGLTWDMLWGLFALPFFAIGAGGLTFTLGLIKWKSKSPGTAEWMPTVKHRGHKSEWTAATGSTGPVTLRPKVGPVGKLLGLLFFAGVWNSVVAFMVYKVIADWNRGRTEWMLIVFAVLFGAVGLLLLFALFHSILGLFTPRPRLVVNSARVRLGETLDLTWRFRGQTGSLRRFRIYLKGEEKATYRRGTDTYTDDEIFAELTLVDTTDSLEMPQGEAQLTIPHDTMHSFDAGNNDITWTLHVEGEIARWPDVSEEHTILILPPGLEDESREEA